MSVYLFAVSSDAPRFLSTTSLLPLKVRFAPAVSKSLVKSVALEERSNRSLAPFSVKLPDTFKAVAPTPSPAGITLAPGDTVKSPSKLPDPDSELQTTNPPGTNMKSQLAAPLLPILKAGLPAIAPPFRTVS